MFCSNCGRQLQSGARFCSFCGSPAVPEEGAPNPYASRSSAPGGDAPRGTARESAWSATGSVPPPRPRLTRPRSDRIIAGVCAGVALHYGWDITLVRILVAVFSLFLGTGVLIYLAAWIIIPEAPLTFPLSL